MDLKGYCDWLENLTNAGDTINSEGLQKWIKKYAEKHHTEQLNLPIVSQQSELLKAFQEFYQTGDYNDEYPFDENINRFLKAFNCG